MKVGLLLLYGIIMLVLGIVEVFFLNGGSLFEKDKDGYAKFRLRGGIDVGGWIKILCLAIGVGFAAAIASAAAWCGLAAFIIMFFAMMFTAYWCFDEASAFKEVAVFIGMLVVEYFVAKMGVIALSGIVRHAAWLSVFKTVPAVELTVCITVMVVEVLQYHARGLHLVHPRTLSEDMRKMYPALAIICGVIGGGIAIALLITGIQWKGF